MTYKKKLKKSGQVNEIRMAEMRIAAGIKI